MIVESYMRRIYLDANSILRLMYSTDIGDAAGVSKIYVSPSSGLEIDSFTNIYSVLQLKNMIDGNSLLLGKPEVLKGICHICDKLHITTNAIFDYKASLVLVSLNINFEL
jgi:hypothetical protein